MGWEDRDYTRDGASGGSSFLHRLNALLNRSYFVGNYVGINVRIHLLFIIFVALELIRSQKWGTSISMDMLIHTFRWTSLLFFAVLLHEFGHALACRRVGGRASEILLWPLGGLAYCEPPRTPYAHFITVVWGPLVNVILGAACVGVLALLNKVSLISFHPFVLINYYDAGFAGLIGDFFAVNYTLFLFNMALIFFPFDAGRLIQIGLWKKLDYRRSMLIACRVGMVGAVPIFFLGMLYTLMLSGIAAFGFFTCYQQLQFLKHGYEGADDGPQFDVGYYDDRKREEQEEEKKPGALTRWKQKREEAKQQREDELKKEAEEKLDAVLEKISQDGIESLTATEKRILKRATADKQREP